LQGTTQAPPRLTERDLISKMEEFGIGTDATVADHIQKQVCSAAQCSGWVEIWEGEDEAGCRRWGCQPSSAWQCACRQ
jgi:hypothetical protein